MFQHSKSNLQRISKKFETFNGKNYQGITKRFGIYLRANYKKSRTK